MRVRSLFSDILAFLTETWPGRLLVAAVVIISLYFKAFDLSGLRYHIDLDVYRSGGQAFVRGFGLYDRDYPVVGVNLPFTYPPLAAIFFGALTWFPLSVDAVLNVLLTAAVAWWCGAILLTHFVPRGQLAGSPTGTETGHSTSVSAPSAPSASTETADISAETDELASSPVAEQVKVTEKGEQKGEGKPATGENPAPPFSRAAWLSFLILPIVLWAEPFDQTFRFGQINVYLMALVLLDIAVRHTRWPRGMFIGLAAAIKLTPAVFGLYFLVKRDWRGAITCVVSAIVWTLLAWVILPTDSKDYWTVEIKNPDRIGGLAYAGNQSLRGMIARFVGGDAQEHWWMALSAVTFLLIVAAMVRLARAAKTTGAADSSVTIALLCANALVALLISPVSWSHHWVWFLAFVIVAVVAARNYRGSTVKRIILWFVAISGFLFTTVLPFHWFFPNSNEQEMAWSLWEKILGSDYVVWGLLFLIVMALWPRAFATERG